MNIIINHFRDKGLQRSQNPAAFVKDAMYAMGISGLLIMAASAAGVIFAGDSYRQLTVNFMHLVLMGAVAAFLKDYFIGLWYMVKENISFADRKAEKKIMTAAAVGFAFVAAAVFAAVWTFVYAASDGMLLSPAEMMALLNNTGGVHNV